MIKKPFAWYGGKQALAPLLVSLLPAHRVYCEVFGGSGALLFAKAPSELEILNDLDSGVANFFRVLRQPEQARALQRQLELTLYAREEYYDCLKGWNEANDPVEKARMWYTAVMQSMNCSIRATGWSSTKKPGSNPAQAWHNSIANLAACHDRLFKAHVQIDHRDFASVIHAYDSAATCFYLDPPYLPDTRKKAQCYLQEMNEDDHKRLLSCILNVKGMVLLSGYTHPLYQVALEAWDCTTLDLPCSSAVNNSTDPGERRRTECIWMNPACVRHQRPRQQSLLTEVLAQQESEVQA
jgi:DNA adenine methylase